MSEDSVQVIAVKETFSWLKGQPFGNVMLFLLTVVLIYAALYVAPAHESAMATRYEKLQEEDAKQRSADRELFERTLDRLVPARHSTSVAN